MARAVRILEVMMDRSMIGKSIDTGHKSGWYHDSCVKWGNYIVREYVLDCSAWVWAEILKDRIKAVRWTDDRLPVVIDCSYNLGGLADYCADMLGRTFSWKEA